MKDEEVCCLLYADGASVKIWVRVEDLIRSDKNPDSISNKNSNEI